jgi:hypothetical protein
MLDAIAPNRRRFNVINTQSRTMQLITAAAVQITAAGREIPKEEPLPGVTEYGRVFDQPAYTAAVLARIAARRKGGAL